MTVKSIDLADGAPVKARGLSGAPLAGALMIAFGLPLWMLGAKYSLDGWVLGLNIVADALTLPATLPRVSGWWALLAVPLGAAYSYVELKVRPSWGGKASRVLAMLLLFLLTHGSDIGSTFLVAVTPAEGAWPLAAWAAEAMWPAALWAVVLTYAPELLLWNGWRMLKP
jgi:hypothetical protein